MSDPVTTLREALKEATRWDNHDSEGVPAVWLDQANKALADTGALNMVNLRGMCPPVSDQGGLASSAACATASAFEMAQAKRSRSFLYHMETKINAGGAST